jgi:polyphosphate kinase 2 (PPK2 family)
MLEQVDLDKQLAKAEYDRILPALGERLYAAQKASWEAGIPVVIVFEGWDAAGKGTTIRLLSSLMDPRGFTIHPIREARGEEKRRPWLWRFWLRLPGRGHWAIFDRSWYGRVLVERVEELAPPKLWRRAYRDIVDFERTLADEGYAILKFWLHITKKEQKRRFKRLSKDPLTAWHVAPEDWEHHAQYDQYARAVEEMLERTTTEWGPWTIVEATDRHFARATVLETILAAIEERLAKLPARTSTGATTAAAGPSPATAVGSPAGAPPSPSTGTI